ncbi:MAG: DoxX family protein [Gammaproteobacteria bacterium]
MSTVNTHDIPDTGLPLRAGLWLAQVLLAGVYLPTGMAALFVPASQVFTIVPWAGHMPQELLRFISGVDLAAGVGVLLPSVTRIASGLTVLAAVCSAVLQGFAIFFHALGMLPTPLTVSLAVIALSVFVAWGRSGKAAITPRWQDRRLSAIDAFASVRADTSERRSEARRRATARGLESCRKEVFGIRRGLRDVPSSRGARKSCSNEIA